MFRQIWPRIRLLRNSKDLLHAENLRHGTDGFTSPPKEGVLRIFFALKIRRLRLTPRPPKPLYESLSGHNHKGILVVMQSARYSCHILMKPNFVANIFENMLKYQISCKSVHWEPSCSMRTDGWTDRHDEANSRFPQFCERDCYISEVGQHRDEGRGFLSVPH